MLSIPQIYSPTDRDITVGLAPGRWQKQTIFSNASTPLAVNHGPVPADMVLLLQHMYSEADPGAAQNVVSHVISVIDDQVLQYGVLDANQNPLAVNLNSYLIRQWGGGIVLMPKEYIRATATFNAGAVPNQVALVTIGILIPRANWQFS
jgi:hypothetical protein